MDTDKLYTTCEQIRTKYPDNFLLETAIEIAHEELQTDKKHYSYLKNKLNSITHFIEKNKYYKTFQERKSGYETNTKKLQNFLENPYVNQYEYWVGESTLSNMQRKGYKAVVRDELLFGRLT